MLACEALRADRPVHGLEYYDRSGEYVLESLRLVRDSGLLKGYR